MRRLTFLLAAIATLVLAACASGASRPVPQGFWGANWSFEITGSSPQMQERNWARMAQSGVESQRALFLWSVAQPNPGSSFDFTQTDELVQLADRHGIDLLPVVAFAPIWARQYDAPSSPPRNPDEYAAYLRALIGRYGPHGSFWSAHRNLRKRPIRAWQIWNEPSANYQWTIPQGTDWAPGYAALLRASHTAVKQADPGAKVVLAGLPNLSWRDLDHLYRVGHVHGLFDVGAVHPFTSAQHGVLTVVRRFRAVMRKYGDGRKPLWVTELGLPASKGHSSDRSPLQTTQAGMSRFMRQSYADLAAHRRQLGVGRLYWFTWASSYSGWIFEYTGLYLFFPRANHGHDLLQPKPALTTYVQIARRAEGCVKTTRGTCRRR
jgi:hypothetical protein